MKMKKNLFHLTIQNYKKDNDDLCSQDNADSDFTWREGEYINFSEFSHNRILYEGKLCVTSQTVKYIKVVTGIITPPIFLSFPQT